MHGCWLVAALSCLAVLCQAQQEDSLRGALEAISRRQRDLAASDGPYYLTDMALNPSRYHDREGDELQFYEGRGEPFPEYGGQPEDIGYGYQKSISPHATGVFEPILLPGSPQQPSIHNAERLLRISEKELEKLAANQVDNNNHFSYKFPQTRFSTGMKRSVFRERVDGNSPEALQNIYGRPQSSGELSRSSFRERHPGRTGLPSGALALVRSFGGLDRDTETGSGGTDDDSEYTRVLNSIWEKYKGNVPDDFDPEDLSETDIEEILDYLNEKGQDKKRQYDSYSNGYDFFNSPNNAFYWNKRSKQKLDSPNTDGFFHSLKFLPGGDREALEALSNDDIPDEDTDEDVARLLVEQKPQYRNNRGGYMKRVWRDGVFDGRYPAVYHSRVSKRFPVTKRSPSFGPGSSLSEQNNKSPGHPTEGKQRRKKNAGEGEGSTDPKVAQELNNIFSTPDNGEKQKADPNVNTNSTAGEIKYSNDSAGATSEPEIFEKDQNKTENKEEKRQERNVLEGEAGQKEESGPSSYSTPLEMKKKSIDWSDYFGIDKRRKKSLNDEWLLNQYLKAYSLQDARSNDVDRSGSTQQFGSDYDVQKKGSDDIDGKLRAMEDLIVDQALKYTGAHEGVTDSREVQQVKDRVMSQLAAAYSLEKMRRALGEFKSSIAAQKASLPPHTTIKPNEDKEEEKKAKRVAVKKEKAELEYKDKTIEKKTQNENVAPIHSVVPSYIQNNRVPVDEECPYFEEIDGRCREISFFAGDRNNNLLLPLCHLHQICYLCGVSNSGTCDVSFLSGAQNICHNSGSCWFTAKRMLVGMRTLKGGPSPGVCEWVKNPCLERFLALATEQR